LELLQTIAEVAATLAGFSGVVFVLGRRAEGRLTPKERSGLVHLLLSSCSALLLALALAAALAVTASHPVTWRVGCGIVGAICLFGATQAAVQQVRGEHGLPRALAWVLPSVGGILGIASLSATTGLFGEFTSAICLACLIWFLVVSVSYFASLLFADQRAAWPPK
jgi:hypothetical protein